MTTFFLLLEAVKALLTVELKLLRDIFNKLTGWEAVPSRMKGSKGGLHHSAGDSRPARFAIQADSLDPCPPILRVKIFASNIF